MDPKEKFIISAPPEWADLRLDKALGSIPEVGTRSRAETLISDGSVWVNGKPAKSSQKIRPRDEIEIRFPERTPSELQPLHRPLDVVFEDEHLIVVNKPAGLVIHPAAGHAQDTLVNMLLAHTDELSVGFHEARPGIVHRLDRDTSGLLVVAKNDPTHWALAQLFQTRNLHRVYHAICIGRPPSERGTIQSYLARHPTDRKRYASLRSDRSSILRDPNLNVDGRWAVTHYQVLSQTSSGLSYLQLKLETGRTHQIRVHLSESGWPIAADETYGAHRRLTTIQNASHRSLISQFPRFALHARELGFRHPATQEDLFFSADWPDDLLPLIRQLQFPGEPEAGSR